MVKQRGKAAPKAPRAPVRTSEEEIRQKAMELFLSQGYHGTSTTDICDALGISRPTLYWYFKDKEAILWSLEEASIEAGFRKMLTVVRQEKDPLDRLRAFIREHANVICRDPATKVLIKETEYMTPDHVAWVKGRWKEQLEIVRGAILELKEAGRCKDVSETFAAFGLIGMLTWAYTWFDFARPEGIPALVETVEEIFLSGLLRPGTPWR